MDTEGGWPYSDFMTIIEADTDPEDAFKQITNRPPGSIVSVPKKGSTTGSNENSIAGDSGDSTSGLESLR